MEKQKQKKTDLFAQIRERLNVDISDEFAVTARTALQAIESSAHPNRIEAAVALRSCINCYKRGDMLAARLLLHVSGALIEDLLCRVTWHVISKSMQPPAPPSAAGHHD